MTETEWFQLLCFNEVGLKNVLSVLNDLEGDSLKVDSNIFRFMAYEQYTWWVHNFLLKGVTKFISSCATCAIRKEFSSKDNSYVPYIESSQEKQQIQESKE